MNTNNLIESFVTKGVSKSVHNAENTSGDLSKMTKVFTIRQGYNAGKQCTFMYLVNAYTDTEHDTFFLSGKVILSSSGSRLIKVSNRSDKVSFHYKVLTNGDIDIYLRLDNSSSIVYIQELLTTSNNIEIEKQNSFVDVSSLSLNQITTEKSLAWGSISLESGVTVHDGFSSLWKDFNTVHLRAYLKGTFSQGIKLGTISEKHRPREYQEIIVICRQDNNYLGNGIISIDNNGVMRLQSMPSNTNIINITGVYLASTMVI